MPATTPVEPHLSRISLERPLEGPVGDEDFTYLLMPVRLV